MRCILIKWMFNGTKNNRSNYYYFVLFLILQDPVRTRLLLQNGILIVIGSLKPKTNLIYSHESARATPDDRVETQYFNIRGIHSPPPRPLFYFIWEQRCECVVTRPGPGQTSKRYTRINDIIETIRWVRMTNKTEKRTDGRREVNKVWITRWSSTALLVCVQWITRGENVGFEYSVIRIY